MFQEFSWPKIVLWFLINMITFEAEEIHIFTYFRWTIAIVDTRSVLKLNELKNMNALICF